MDDHSRNAAFLGLFGRGMAVSNEKMTASTLGDRSQYVGLSDLAKYRECPRAAIAGKLFSVTPTTENLLPLMRGHWFEDGIADCFDSLGLAGMRQLEIRHEHNGVPIKAHLDICLVSDNPKPTVRIVEVKSTATLPTVARSNHEYQARAQVTLFHAMWNKPAFTLRDNAGNILHANKTFPTLCRDHFGVSMPDNPDLASVESWLLCLDMNTAVAFGPHTYSQETLHQIERDAHDFWEGLKFVKGNRDALADVRCADGFHVLCTSCAFSEGCPKFRLAAESLPQWEPALAKLKALKDSKTELETDIREIESAVRQAYQLSGSDAWVKAGQYKFRVSQMPGRRSFSKDALSDELTTLFAHENIHMDVPTLLANCEREGTPYSTLRIMPTAA